MKPEIENLKAWMSGKITTGYQRALAMREFEQLLTYVAELEQLRQQPVSGWQDFTSKPANGEEIIVWNIETNHKMFLLWNDLYDLIISSNDRWISLPPACT